MKKYKGTLLYDYLKRKKKDLDHDTFKTIVYEHIKTKNYAIPDDDELVIHLRLGDKFNKEESEWCPKWYNCDESDNMIIKGLEKIQFEKHKIKKVSIVSIFHYRTTAEDGQKRSIERFELFKNFFERKGIPVKTISRTADEDFCYLVSSKFFLPTIGGFSRLAYELCDGEKFLINNDYTYPKRIFERCDFWIGQIGILLKKYFPKVYSILKK